MSTVHHADGESVLCWCEPPVRGPGQAAVADPDTHHHDSAQRAHHHCHRAAYHREGGAVSAVKQDMFTAIKVYIFCSLHVFQYLKYGWIFKIHVPTDVPGPSTLASCYLSAGCPGGMWLGHYWAQWAQQGQEQSSYILCKHISDMISSISIVVQNHFKIVSLLNISFRMVCAHRSFVGTCLWN